MSIPRGYRQRERAARERNLRRLATPEIREARAAQLERQAAIARGEVLDEEVLSPTPTTLTPENTETVVPTPEPETDPGQDDAQDEGQNADDEAGSGDGDADGEGETKTDEAKGDEPAPPAKNKGGRPKKQA